VGGHHPWGGRPLAGLAVGSGGIQKERRPEEGGHLAAVAGSTVVAAESYRHLAAGQAACPTCSVHRLIEIEGCGVEIPMRECQNVHLC